MGKKKKISKAGKPDKSKPAQEPEEGISRMSLEGESSQFSQQIEDLRRRLLNDPVHALEIMQESTHNGALLIPVLYELNESKDCVAVITLLGKLVLSYETARRFSEMFLQKRGSPLKGFEVVGHSGSEENRVEPSPKKARGLSVIWYQLEGQERKVLDVPRVENMFKSLLILMKTVPPRVYSRWDMNEFFAFQSVDFSDSIRWYAANCISCLLNMTETETKALEGFFHISPATSVRLSMEHQHLVQNLYSHYAVAIEHSDSLVTTTSTSNEIHHIDGTENLVSVGGIVVRQSKTTEDLQCEDVVIFPSFMDRMKDVVIHIVNCAPVCVVGPMGCGKSNVLRQVFTTFGRQDYPSLINVQMNDQMDSRVILGTYHSTDLPGQFVWKPGCLTKAILNGHWILFEDIDAAPMDVITLLDGFIDTKTISIPGYGEIESLHPDFRMFATCRQIDANHRPNHTRLSKLWKKMYMSGYTTDELKQIVHTRFPHLTTIADVLVNLFTAVSSTLKSMKTGSARNLSIRDFFKFCQRIPYDMDFTSAASAISIFQNGLDLFVLSIRDTLTREAAAEIIGTHLNLLKAKVEYYLTMYSPIVLTCTNTNSFICGRFNLSIDKPSALRLRRSTTEIYALTRRTCNTMEAVAGFVKNKEPVLLVGETGVGKTSCVQHLANVLNRKLVVVNLNRQSDAVDLLGGYKPVELKYIFLPIREEFEALFSETFNKEANNKYMDHIMTCYANKRWNDLIKLMRHVEKSAVQKCQNKNEEVVSRWLTLFRRIARVESQITEAEESPFAFSFIDGTLIKAIKNGDWILLDEINLATSEMLQCLSGILDEHAQIHLWEKGDERPVKRHPSFHLFAAMNPSTDFGKKDLPVGIRNRFSELYVSEITDMDELRVLVGDYLKDLCLSSAQVNNIVQFYVKIRRMADTSLVDGLGKPPHYSLRTLCRALKIASMKLFGSVQRSLYESFCLSFLTQLDFQSHPIVEQLVAEHVFGKTNIKTITNQPIPCPQQRSDYVNVEGYWVPRGDMEPIIPNNYILTPSIRRNLKDIARIISAGKLPVLIQGATSVGKTSLVQYLAQCSGNRCYRINNHQHTDLQEYIGSYQSDDKGKLVFAEGVLVQAMRKGEWVILDELNLAPSEVLEALNRLLDDNRQLFITETGVTVTAHPRFMLFATQNPPGLYGGRKVLSRAFRNRFVELHFDEIPSLELETILQQRCAIPLSYCKKIIGVLKDLQVQRKASAALQGKHGFATLRDLFRWAERYRLSGEQKAKFYDWDQHLADEGYLVLAGKERKDSEAAVIQEVLQKRFKRQVDPNNLFSLHEKTSTVTREILELVLNSDIPEFKHIVWTSQLRRLIVLIGCAMKFKEPLLLVGETGCGKTSVVQLLSQLLHRKLFCVNCHMNSEGSDFLGGLRPVRNAEDGRLFEWVDGPLVEAMECGGIFLADEISLADDSVLERLNSVLEPERTLLIAEKGEENPRMVVAHPDFHFVGTMNPGGDYGKKELSLALRNRLTEIWCSATTNEEDLKAIIEHNLRDGIQQKGVSHILVNFIEWLRNNDLGQKCTISIRDYLAWVSFINHMTNPLTSRSQPIGLKNAVIHGACMTVLDGLGTGNTGGESTVFVDALRASAFDYLRGMCQMTLACYGEEETVQDTTRMAITIDSGVITCGPFQLEVNPLTPHVATDCRFSMDAPTTSINAMRLLRAMQLSKPILLEGSPGVGKTALVSALANIAGYSLTRINLSEQTDISDLFGADLPVEGKEGGHFTWRDGPLLQALKTNAWILLDEVNLASQSVLEGLNACLDHRGSVYIPELKKTFHISDSAVRSRIFGCQNPVRQGGARKGLPKSFLNRFIQVYVDTLSENDFNFVLQKSFPEIPSPTARLMSTFASRLHTVICEKGQLGVKGGPWDVNLRDLMRWAELTVGNRPNECFNLTHEFYPEIYVDMMYGLRMRSGRDRQKVLQLFCQTTRDLFPQVDLQWTSLRWGAADLVVLDNEIICGEASLKRSGSVEFNPEKLLVLRKDMAQLEALITCLRAGWMPILVGFSGCGKTSLVKLVAEMCGRQLQVMHPSPEMDTMELLGGFEQADIYRRIYDVQDQLTSLIQRYVKYLILSNRRTNEVLVSVWSSLRTLVNLMPEGELAQDEEVKRIWARVDFLQDAYLKCKSFAYSELCNLVVFSSSHEKRNSSVEKDSFIPLNKEEEEERLHRISKELEQIRTHLKPGMQNGAFQWLDSRLIKAMKNGDWLLIDGANRCSAAVLDRLNSLMEPNGSIILSERGSIDGNILEVKPHPEFRLILTVDPTYGEISRAMRNRGVEIYMGSEEDEEQNLLSPETNEEEKNTESRVGSGKIVSRHSLDLNSMLKAGGASDDHLRDVLMNLHSTLNPRLGFSWNESLPEFSFKVVSSTKEIVHQLQLGISLKEACVRSLRNWYLDENNEQKLESTVEEAFILIKAQMLPQENQRDSIRKPLIPLALQNFMNSYLYRVWKHLEVLETGLRLVDKSYSLTEAKLLEDFLAVSLFSRVRKSDSCVLSTALGIRFPLKVTFANKLAGILNSEEFLVLADWKQPFWDIQELPYVLEKFLKNNDPGKIRHVLTTLKLSLRMYAQVEFLCAGSTMEFAKGTLGYALKTAKFSEVGQLHDFLKAFFTLALKYHSIYDTCLAESTDAEITKMTVETISQLWVDGMKALLWTKWLDDLCSSPCQTSLPDEKLLSNMHLMVEWISKSVVPTFGSLNSTTGGKQLQALLNDCFKTAEECRDEDLLRKNKLMRELHAIGTLSRMSSLKDWENFMNLVQTIWSLGDAIPRELLQFFFLSRESEGIYDTVSDICRRALEGTKLTDEDLGNVSSISKQIEALQEDDVPANTVLIYLFALQEFLNIQGKCSQRHSSFINPLYSISLKEGTDSPISVFLEWEHIQRFRQMFSITEFNIRNTSLLPLFVSNILVDPEKMVYRIPSLQNNGVVQKCQTETLNILANQLVTGREEQGLKTSIEEFQTIMQKWTQLVNSIGNQSQELFQHWQEQLNEIAETVNHSINMDKKQKALIWIQLGLIMIEASSFMMEISSSLPAVDPVVEKEILAVYLEEQIMVLKSWVESKRLHDLVRLGQENVEGYSHPYVSTVLQNISDDMQSLNDAKKGIIPRPKPPMYGQLIKDIQQFVSNFGTLTKSRKMSSLIQHLIHSENHPTTEIISSVRIECENWLDCHRNFVQKIGRNFWYWDITAAFLVTSVHASRGYELVHSNLRSYFSNAKMDCILSMIEFPIPYESKTVNLSGVYEEEWAEQKANKRFFMSSIQSFANSLKSQQIITNEITIQLHKYCLEFVHWWNTQEEEKQRKREEEDAFYVFKGKEKAMGKTDEEQEEDEIMMMFPSFDSDYDDLQEINVLADGIYRSKPSFMNPAECGTLLPRDVKVLLDVISYASYLVENQWLSRKSSSAALDFMQPFLDRFQTGCFVFLEEMNSVALTEEENSEFATSATVAAYHLSAGTLGGTWNPSTYNFYYDPNISEAQKLQNLFSGLKLRIGELLADWPDHPALQQILKIVSRIESFPIDSPIMKFLTGLEMLLGVCQEWEGVASKRVSISSFLEDITRLIISWRKLELRFWKNLLEHTASTYQDEARSWWFHLLSSVVELVSQDNNATGSLALLPLLQRFMESSTVGDFAVRLNLLEILHRYLVLLDSHGLLKVKTDVQSTLWNTIRYYAMFQEPVNTKLQALRAPIEKYLKDFIKISRWNDANFYALLDSIKKSQKTLNKVVVEFKKVLQTPVSSILVADVETDDGKKLKYKHIKTNPKFYTASLDSMTAFIATADYASAFSSSPVRQARYKRLPKLYKKSRDLAITLFQRDHNLCEEETVELNNLVGTIIEKIHVLQNQQIPDSGPQRKKALHYIHNLRRTNLAELFRTLNSYQLSYKKGIIKLQNLPEGCKLPYDFLIPPIDVSAGWNIFCRNLKQGADLGADSHIIKAWNSCDDYFQKTIARMSALLMSFQNPSKELGSVINERCKGFAVELFNLVCQQRKMMEKFSSSLWNLKLFSEHDEMSNKNVLFGKWTTSFYFKICNLEFQFSQHKLLFEAVVKSHALETGQQLLDVADTVLKSITDLKMDISLSLSKIASSKQVYSFFDPSKLQHWKQRMADIRNNFQQASTILIPTSALARKIEKSSIFVEQCEDDLIQFEESLTSDQSGDSSVSTRNFKLAATKLLDTVLSGFQKLKTLDVSASSDSLDGTSWITLRQLDVPTVCNELLKMRSILCKKIAKTDCSKLLFIYESLKPLVQQFVLTSQFYLTQALEHHRETCKLTYVLSGIFTTLAQKGFCLPSDYEDEAIEEGAEMDAKSGMGMGEGELTSDAKDVSDRFESEDQLEDTLKAGESAPSAEKDVKDDDTGIEMNENFEGKQQDKEKSKEEKEGDSEYSGDEEENEQLDKEMGDIDGEDEDIVDDKMWGGSSDEEDEESENKDSNEGKGVAENEQPELAPKESELNSSENDPRPKEKPEKDYKEMDEGEINDDQVDPYHGQNAPEEEPEAMDLPDDLNLDEENKDDEKEDKETNPFDLDSKEIGDFNDVEMEEEESKKEEEGEKEISDKGENDDEDMDIDAPHLDTNEEHDVEAEEEKRPESDVPPADSKIDDSEDQTVQDTEQEEEVPAAEQETKHDVEEAETTQDKAKEANVSGLDAEQAARENQETVMDAVQEEEKSAKEDDTSGQVNSKDGHGEEGQAKKNDNAESSESKDERNTSKKPGETDKNRTLALDITKNRLKTAKEQNDSPDDEDMNVENDSNDDKQADYYQHIKEAEQHDALTLDNATQEQVNQRKNMETKEESELLPEMDEEMENEEQNDEDDHDDDDVKMESNPPPDLIKGLPQDKKKKKRSQEMEEQKDEEVVETPGEKALTYGAQRPSESTIHTQPHLLENKSTNNESERMLQEVPSFHRRTDNEVVLMNEWHELERKTLPLSQELCEQLRLILEPTQASKLKGDYKTGKRLNMRKVIPYIASGFRKDKIWLRRTQPSKREYQVLLALDDSASMCDNQSKQMAFSAVAVVAKALSLLEVGQLAVLSFGEDVQLLHPFEESFTDFTGARLMTQFTFAQRKTRIVQLMETTAALFNHSRQTYGHSSAPVEMAQLLLIISDGRAVSHEGNDVVKNAVKKAMEQNVFVVFVIVDNPENQHSILDIQKPIFKEGKSVQFIKYMDDFPFPFYLILRDLSTLPSVLSDALRQWFELVTSSAR